MPPTIHWTKKKRLLAKRNASTVKSLMGWAMQNLPAVRAVRLQVEEQRREARVQLTHNYPALDVAAIRKWKLQAELPVCNAEAILQAVDAQAD